MDQSSQIKSVWNLGTDPDGQIQVGSSSDGTGQVKRERAQEWEGEK